MHNSTCQNASRCSVLRTLIIRAAVILILGSAVVLYVTPAEAIKGTESAAANATFRGAVEHNASVAPGGAGVWSADPLPSSSNATPMFMSTPAEAATQGSGWGNYFQAVGVLLLILGMLYMGLWALKRFGKLKGFGSKLARQGLTVEGQFHIGPKKTLVVVRFLNKRLLLGVTDHQINLLTEMEAENDPTHDTDSADFGGILDEAGNKDSSS